MSVCLCILIDVLDSHFRIILTICVTTHCSHCSWFTIMKYFGSSDVYTKKVIGKIGVLIFKSKDHRRTFLQDLVQVMEDVLSPIIPISDKSSKCLERLEGFKLSSFMHATVLDMS